VAGQFNHCLYCVKIHITMQLNTADWVPSCSCLMSDKAHDGIHRPRSERKSRRDRRKGKKESRQQVKFVLIHIVDFISVFLNRQHQLARLRVQRRGSESYWPVRRLIQRPQTKTGSVWSRRQTSKWCTGKPDPSNLYQDEGWWLALVGVETCQWSTTDHLDPPDLSWHGCYSDWGPAASGGQTVLANNRGRLRLIASRQYYYYYFLHRRPVAPKGVVSPLTGVHGQGLSWDPKPASP